MIKVIKHLRTMGGLDAVSFHVESLLYRIDDSQFIGGPAEYIPRVLSFIAGITAEERPKLSFTAEEFGRVKR